MEAKVLETVSGNNWEQWKVLGENQKSSCGRLTWPCAKVELLDYVLGVITKADQGGYRETGT